MGFARVALVTGSGKRRVGFEVARSLGQAGFRVILHYQTSRAEAEESSQVLAAEGIVDRKSTRLNSSHVSESRMPSSA